MGGDMCLWVDAGVGGDHPPFWRANLGVAPRHKSPLQAGGRGCGI